MRILVADQNALLLAAIAATFGRHCEIVTATRRDECMAHLEKQKFDLVVACDKLADYTGLELLSEITAASPETLQILAASPARLKRLGRRLDLFGLLGTLSYPIDPRKLVVAFKVARSKLPPRVKPPAAPRIEPKKVHHVVLESEWDTGERLSLLARDLETTPPPGFEAPAADGSADGGSFEFLFDENPSRIGTVSHHIAALERALQGPPVSEVVVFEAPVAEAPVPETRVLEAPVRATPVSAVPAADRAPPYVDDGAANDPTFANAPAGASRPPSQGRSQGRGQKPPAAPKSAAPTNGAPSPRPRTPTVPTAAQRQAFQRALARRNAERSAGGASLSPQGPPGFNGSRKWKVKAGPKATPIGSDPVAGSEAPVINTPTRHQHNAPVTSPFAGTLSGQSLGDLARMTTIKRPLPQYRSHGGSPKRAVFALGSGLAAAILVGVVTFELLRAGGPPPNQGHHRSAATTPLFGATHNLPANSEVSPGSQASTPVSQSASTPENVVSPALPQPQTFDPDTAPPDPPPPPALEHPGPMEPPSVHNEPHIGMPPGSSTED